MNTSVYHSLAALAGIMSAGAVNVLARMSAQPEITAITYARHGVWNVTTTQHGIGIVAEIAIVLAVFAAFAAARKWSVR